MDSAIDEAVLAKERRQLYLYAVMRLRDADLAEDVVQETLVAAVQALDRFEQRASLRTWLMAILRNKIVDAVRRSGREVPFDEDTMSGNGEAEDADLGYDEVGHWQPAAAPGSWNSPEAAMNQSEFWGVFEHCLQGLPVRTGEVFYLREVVGESIADICKNLDISETNCSVMLFRARARLRECLERKWFGTAP